jgi:hypothetical protein
LFAAQDDELLAMLVQHITTTGSQHQQLVLHQEEPPKLHKEQGYSSFHQGSNHLCCSCYFWGTFYPLDPDTAFGEGSHVLSFSQDSTSQESLNPMHGGTSIQVLLVVQCS